MFNHMMNQDDVAPPVIIQSHNNLEPDSTALPGNSHWNREKKALAMLETMPNKMSNRSCAAVGVPVGAALGAEVGALIGDMDGRLMGAVEGWLVGRQVAVGSSLTTHWQVVTSHVADWQGLVFLVQSLSMVHAGFLQSERYKSHWFCMRTRC